MHTALSGVGGDEDALSAVMEHPAHQFPATLHPVSSEPTRAPRAAP